MLQGMADSVKRVFARRATAPPVQVDASGRFIDPFADWKPRTAPRTAPECGVVVHLYYPEMWDEIADYLANVRQPFGLHISLCSSTAGNVLSHIREKYPDADIATLENRGRDIAPFNHFLTQGKLDRYLCVCKIHTKKSPHRWDGDDWRRMLMDELLGSSGRVDYVVDSFRRITDLGVVGPAAMCFSRKDRWGDNRHIFDDLAARLNLGEEDSLRFFAGSMFWFRPAAFELLRRLDLKFEDFPEEAGQLDGTLAHAMERLFSRAAVAQGYRALGLSSHPPGLFDEERYVAAHPEVTERIENRDYKAGYQFLINEGFPDGLWPHCFRPAELGRPLPGADVRLVAFHLPQFHPIPENDKWWGRGFTEWTNVIKGKSHFPGHEQPRLPSDLGFYDLRNDETRDAQAELAEYHGVHAFCHYYYWFNGKRLLHRPLDAMLKTGTPNFPFCLCWANENWSRRWNGGDKEILIPQTYQPGFASRFIEDILPFLEDPRYLQYEGKPILLVYDALSIPEIASVTDTWRKACKRRGLRDVHLAAVRKPYYPDADCKNAGFDSVVNFPPFGVSYKELTTEIEGLDPAFRGKIYDYATVVDGDLARGETEDHSFVHRGVMLGWDNTARMGLDSHIAHGCTPETYERWLAGVVRQVRERPGTESPLVFINAWNEWAEGTYLEPDQRHGSAYLKATARALAYAPTPAEAERPLQGA
ncbi:MAG TPA: glycoside hydrolase family 99-like domain-containing protein [Pirellulaceae bacterium]|jgi:lipopolysaccharide biosynthesis protein|nr:glycoside hydrolase family 99-like domain-containing protein [Pirellulaceae bacterium]